MPEKVSKAAEVAGLSPDQIHKLIVAVKSGVSTALDEIPRINFSDKGSYTSRHQASVCGLL